MKSNEERLQDLLAYVDSLTRVHPSEIPGIDLYMDQVTTFMDSHLNTSKWLGEDKILPMANWLADRFLREVLDGIGPERLVYPE